MTPALDGQIGPSKPFKGPVEGVEAHDLAGGQRFLVGDRTSNYQGTGGGFLGFLEPFRGFLGLFLEFLGLFLGFRA